MRSSLIRCGARGNSAIRTDFPMVPKIRGAGHARSLAADRSCGRGARHANCGTRNRAPARPAVRSYGEGKARFSPSAPDSGSGRRGARLRARPDEQRSGRVIEEERLRVLRLQAVGAHAMVARRQCRRLRKAERTTLHVARKAGIARCLAHFAGGGVHPFEAGMGTNRDQARVHTASDAHRLGDRRRKRCKQHQQGAEPYKQMSRLEARLHVRILAAVPAHPGSALLGLGGRHQLASNRFRLESRRRGRARECTSPHNQESP